ncbi:MAG: succinate dehydrogenase, cytochrome b556 subunit [Nitratireductor sp.]|nr:succinate dehydrogenase, cytochrome b556 subunit [Nitratireductor sp.]
MSEASTRGAANRPLSPHLQIYKPIPTMVMSILHRITGVALYGGMLILAWWLIAAASGQEYFDFVNGIVGSWLGLLILFGFTWALVHHMLGGIKHLVQDTGRALEKHFTTKLAKVHIVASVAITVLLWIIALAAS